MLSIRLRLYAVKKKKNRIPLNRELQTGSFFECDPGDLLQKGGGGLWIITSVHTHTHTRFDLRRLLEAERKRVVRAEGPATIFCW